MKRKEFMYTLAIAGFIMGLMISSLTASKLYELNIFSYSVIIPVGTTLFALTFICTDLMSEVWGKRHATQMVWAGFIMRVFSLLFLYFAVNVEGAGLPIWDNQDAYSSIFMSSSRILIAGIVTYPISQLADIYIFHYLKRSQEGKDLLWLRNTGSTFVSQLIDSSVFITIAFVGIVPHDVLINMIIGQVVIKWIIALVDTPIVYVLRNYITERKLFDFRG